MPRRSLLVALLGSTFFVVSVFLFRGPRSPTAIAEAPPSRDVDRLIARVGALEFRLVRDLADVGGDHPIVDTHYSAHDTQTNKSVAITEIISEAELLKAVMESPAVTAALGDDEGEAAPLRSARTLKEWEEALQPLSLRFAFSNECETQELKSIDLNSFAIVDFDPASSRMALHLALQTESAECNGDFPRLRVEIKAPNALVEPLRRAKLGEKGFFAPATDRKVCDTCSEGEVASGFFVGA